MGLDLTDVPENEGPVLVPAGKYLVTCVEAEYKDTKTMGGKYIETKLQIKDGDWEGKNVFARFNIINQNDKAAEIGKGQLKSFLIKTGFADPNQLDDVNDLCGLTCIAVVTVRKDENHGDQNDVKYFQDPKDETAATDFAPPKDDPFS